MKKTLLFSMLTSSFIISSGQMAEAQIKDCKDGPDEAQWCKETGATIQGGVGMTQFGLARNLVNAGGTIQSFHSDDGKHMGSSEKYVDSVSSQMAYPFGPDEEAHFVSTTDGFVYRLKPDGTCIWRTLIARTDQNVIHDIGCKNLKLDEAASCPGDQVTSIPAIRPGEKRTSVIVGTRYATTGPGACNNKFSNRIYSLDADTGEPIWVMNEAKGNETKPESFDATEKPHRSMSFIAGGGAPEFWGSCESAQDAIWFASNGNGLSSEEANIYYAKGDGSSFSTIQLKGPRFVTTPIRSYSSEACGRIYLASADTEKPGFYYNGAYALGTTKKACEGKDVPCVLWRTNHRRGGGNSEYMQSTTKDFVFDNQTTNLVLTGEDKQIHVVRDTGGNGEFVCSFGDKVVNSSPSLLTDRRLEVEKIYAGNVKGQVVEANQNCEKQNAIMIDEGTIVGRPFLDATPDRKELFLVVGNDKGRVVRLNVPFK